MKITTPARGEIAEEPLQQADPEFDEIRAAVSEGLAQAARGEGKPAREVFAELRARHAIAPRSSVPDAKNSH
jgi:predicted transcriptional regulator